MIRAARTGAVAAVALCGHAVVNMRRLRTAPPFVAPVQERVSVLLPLRDEAAHVTECLPALRVALEAFEHAEIVAVDDESTDGTPQAFRLAAGGDHRIRLLSGAPLPNGWVGKPHACQQAAENADPESTVFIFVDADVLVHPHGLARAVMLLRESGLQLVSPYPQQLCETPAERLVQPLLQWSWLTFLPLRAAERSHRPSLGAANGQLLVVDADAYRIVGGHASVRDAVVEDMELLRAFKRRGFRGVVTDGTDLATCRMYDDWTSLRDGYTKSLWTVFGSPRRAVVAIAVLSLAYVVPPVALLFRRRDRILAVGTLAGVAGRALVASRVDGRVWPDSAAHPASIAVAGWLTVRSLRLRRSNALQWKGRPV